ncbi:sigma 54-interacting transcriptional regulator [Pyxidicoccus fallax]|uniref:Sigma 54-interacting transcriptional regulator n=1 Tax=Pyxidicoccus fallax TaxID=394095 RepID=A0A848LEM5_9BACT|nr:sigma 54-interacting transcriptional regulator [Pyxidicoccus fallax]NMO16926.1 sigma 54-interacting transcriptional regulator [Pyxidicoccus fallax]NPC84160.1 sigma 54-interacting transcriptional regulator [Pyxidicoccus fallax]
MTTGPETQEDSRQQRARPEPPRPGLVFIFSGGAPMFRPVPLDGGRLVLGREDAGGQPLPDERLSRQHAEVRHEEARWHVEDLGSRNGTSVDGVQVLARRAFSEPRVLRLGNTLALFHEDVRRLAGADVQVAPDSVRGPGFNAALERVAAAATAGETLLITGESGTGKELAARAYHRAGPNARGRFVDINCAAVPASVAERLLFGSRRGAYSGADADTEGYVQAADRGVLFLDEVAELSPEVQAKLLRVLETREVLALGASRATPVDVRVCSATHKDLRAAVAAGQFRADLYYRLAQAEVRLPPLRERPEDVPWLLAHALRDSPTAPSVHATYVEACLSRPWPGNVRELLGEARRAARDATAAGSRSLRAEHLDPEAGTALTPPASPSAATVTPDRATVEATLAEHGGNISAAARALGLHRTQLYRLLQRWGLGTS